MCVRFFTSYTLMVRSHQKRCKFSARVDPMSKVNEQNIFAGGANAANTSDAKLRKPIIVAILRLL